MPAIKNTGKHEVKMCYDGKKHKKEMQVYNYTGYFYE